MDSFPCVSSKSRKGQPNTGASQALGQGTGSLYAAPPLTPLPTSSLNPPPPPMPLSQLFSPGSSNPHPPPPGVPTPLWPLEHTPGPAPGAALKLTGRSSPAREGHWYLQKRLWAHCSSRSVQGTASQDRSHGASHLDQR